MATITGDVGIWGDHPSSIWAAFSVAEQGLRPILFTSSRYIGTPYTSGLGRIDTGRYATRTLNMGRWHSYRFFSRLSRYMGTRSQIRVCSPSLAHQVIQDLLSYYGIPVLTQVELTGINKAGDNSIISATLSTGHTVAATNWVDGSEDADFAAMAGVQFRVGREGTLDFNESYAGYRPYFKLTGYPWETVPGSGVPIRGIRLDPGLAVGAPDPFSQQPFGWRCSLTNMKRNRRHWPKPLVYDRSLFEYRLRSPGVTWDAGANKWTGYLYENPAYVPINPLAFTMHGKVDLNDDSGGGNSHLWASANKATRDQLFQDTANEYFGLRYFLATDPAVHPNVQRVMNQWGPCIDEFGASSSSTGVPPGMPFTFYRRGTRRMSNALWTMKQADVTDVAPLKADSIALSLYGLDCHTVSRVAAPDGIWIDGNNQATLDEDYAIHRPPSEVPMRCMLTTDVPNIVVTNCIGSTFIAYTKLRIDLHKANQGAAGGLLAARSVIEAIPMHSYPITPEGTPGTLQNRILALGGAIHADLPDLARGEPDEDFLEERGGG
jgi:hypothetical protein